ncbi:MAG TPA: rRNA maturation RNase YbeY [Burkholderiales bacterium]|nr:rRNA maturation RNase YbeY [Burkholderiales bacterium]
MKVRVDVQVATAIDGLPSRTALAGWARAALTGLRRRRVSVTLRLIGKRESTTLNGRFRRKHKPTNVLSFPFDAPPGTRSDLLGDVAICVEVVRREARDQGKPERAHWAHMVVHGIMHLRGYDHHDDKQAAVMEAKETRILRGLGFPNPYA